MFRRVMLQRMSAVIAATVAATLLAIPTTEAAKLKSQNLTQLISASETIIAGEVESVTDGIDANGVPYTEVTIRVELTAKGKVSDDSLYTFRQFGLLKPRKMENGLELLAVAPEGFARWREGEFVMAFMYKAASGTGLRTTAGMAQGKLNMVGSSLVNEFNNTGMFEGVQIDDSLLSSEEQNMLTTPGAVNAQTFMNLVTRAVSEQWIENGEMR